VIQPEGRHTVLMDLQKCQNVASPTDEEGARLPGRPEPTMGCQLVLICDVSHVLTFDSGSHLVLHYSAKRLLNRVMYICLHQI
jgi:hypothetical protein